MTGDQEQWQLDQSAAELYQRHFVRAVTDLWAADLVERADVADGERVLDVACGTGVVARHAATRAGVRGRVEALDVNPAMLAFARRLPAPVGAPVAWREASALALPYAARSFDVVLCQLGLQFFPDRLGALREMHRTLVPGGRLALNVFGPIEHNPATHALADALDRHVGPDASLAKRAEHALADTAALGTLLHEAGFAELVIETATKIVRFDSPAEYVRIQLAATPLAAVAAAVDPACRDRLVEAVTADVSRALATYDSKDGLAFPQEVHIVLARVGTHTL